MNKISFVIPCYRSAKTVGHVVEEIVSTVSNISDYEVILVNDASPDNTLSVLIELAGSNKKVKVVDLAKNFGQQGAWMSGFQYVTGDLVVILDDDGQCPVQELPKLLSKLNEGYDVVFSKYPNKKHSFTRKIATRVNFWFAEVLVGKPKGLAITNFCVLRRYVISEVIKYTNPYPYFAGIVLKITDKIANVEVEHRSRISGESGYNLRKLISLCLDGFTAFSIKPLRIASVSGVLFTILSFLYGIYLIIQKLLHPEIPLGYSSLMTATLFLSGAIMLMLGLMGEYLGRIYISLNRIPQYVVRGTFNLETPSSLQSTKEKGHTFIN
ncbi:MAG: glycosyltransferase family 2 protein [Bdellovibrionales bacterium]|nr:glycosyltransferase family 2 protein [Bdellovibrionales bacterium]